MKNARIIDIYSVENSNAVASDLLTKLLYLGLSCRHFDDYYHQKISGGKSDFSGCGSGDFLFRIFQRYGRGHERGEKKRSSYHCNHKFQGFSDYEYADLVICTSQQQLFYGDAIFPEQHR